MQGKHNPIKTLAIINMALLVAFLAIYIFWNKKTDGEKVGYFLREDEPAPAAVPPATPTQNV